MYLSHRDYMSGKQACSSMVIVFIGFLYFFRCRGVPTHTLYGSQTRTSAGDGKLKRTRYIGSLCANLTKYENGVHFKSGDTKEIFKCSLRLQNKATGIRQSQATERHINGPYSNQQQSRSVPKPTVLKKKYVPYTKRSCPSEPYSQHGLKILDQKPRTNTERSQDLGGPEKSHKFSAVYQCKRQRYFRDYPTEPHSQCILFGP